MASESVGLGSSTPSVRGGADALIALADGIGVGYLLRPRLFPPERQLQLVDRMLATQLGLPLGAEGDRR